MNSPQIPSFLYIIILLAWHYTPFLKHKTKLELQTFLYCLFFDTQCKKTAQFDFLKHFLNAKFSFHDMIV